MGFIGRAIGRKITNVPEEFASTPEGKAALVRSERKMDTAFAYLASLEPSLRDRRSTHLGSVQRTTDADGPADPRRTRPRQHLRPDASPGLAATSPPLLDLVPRYFDPAAVTAVLTDDVIINALQTPTATAAPKVAASPA